METNPFSFHNSDPKSPNLKSSSALLDIGHMKSYNNVVFPKGSFDIGLTHSKASHPDDARNWLYQLPYFRQAFAPVETPVSNQQPFDKAGGLENLKIGTGCAQKRFLIFDQSGDQTTLLHSSVIGSCNPQLPATYNHLKEKPGIDKEAISPLWPFVNDVNDEGNPTDELESEMHEDTEELNALLYSDDDTSYSEDDEETSTGHSPSTMTSNGIHDSFEEKGEEAATFAKSKKRLKLLHGGFNVPSPVDAASSWHCFAQSELEDDAESSCGNIHNEAPRKFSSLSGEKRSRKENIRETVRVLKSIIPDGKGKDSMDIIDEAIRYLRFLKTKAKDLGLDTLRF